MRTLLTLLCCAGLAAAAPSTKRVVNLPEKHDAEIRDTELYVDGSLAPAGTYVFSDGSALVVRPDGRLEVHNVKNGDEALSVR